MVQAALPPGAIPIDLPGCPGAYTLPPGVSRSNTDQLPHDADAERAVIVVALSTPEVLGKALEISPPSNFFDRVRQGIATAIVATISDGETPDVTTVTRRLADHSATKLPSRAALMELQAISEMPYVGGAEQHARVIRDHYIRRERILIEQDRIAKLRAGKRPLADVEREADQRVAALVGPQEREVATTSVSEVVGRIQSSGDRVPLGFAPIDELSKGGVFQDFRIFFGGAPGTFKTGLCSQLAFNMARAGWCVRWIAIDEGPEEVLVRWLQQDGIEQDNAEQLATPEAVAAARTIEGLDIQFSESPLIDSDLHWTETNPLRVVFIDSLQQAMVEGAEGADPRARIDAVLKAIKRLFSANRILTIATSELARSAYRNSNSQDATDPIAALKESGALEYYASILAVMRSVRDEPDLVEVQVPKVRRGGRKGEFCLSADRSRCLLHLVRTDSNAAGLAHDRVLDEIATEALTILRRFPDGLTVTALRGELRNRPGEQGFKNTRLAAALARLEKAGAAKSRAGKNNSTRWFGLSNRQEDDFNGNH